MTANDSSARRVYNAALRVAFPGVIAHELSHLLVAEALDLEARFEPPASVAIDLDGDHRPAELVAVGLAPLGLSMFAGAVALAAYGAVKLGVPVPRVSPPPILWGWLAINLALAILPSRTDLRTTLSLQHSMMNSTGPDQTASRRETSTTDRPDRREQR
jgi:hypothetical protein